MWTETPLSATYFHTPPTAISCYCLESRKNGHYHGVEVQYENAIEMHQTSKVSPIPRQTGSLVGSPRCRRSRWLGLICLKWREGKGLRAPGCTGQTPKLKEKFRGRARFVLVYQSETHRGPRDLTRRLMNLSWSPRNYLNLKA